MNIRNYIELMRVIEKLKCNTRHSWTSTGRHESVAEHSWRLSLMAYFIKDEFPMANINKVMLMCLCHDLGEVFTGDIPAFLKTNIDEINEENAVNGFLTELPQPYQQELKILFKEMKAVQTLEARIYKALDKMEALLQHNEADLATWIECEYHDNLVYGENEVLFSKYMKELKEEIRRDSTQKMNSSI